MKKYPKYKDSGVSWIGEIPEGWNKDKVLRLFGIIGSGTTPRNANEGQIPWINSGDLNNGILTQTTKYVSEETLMQNSSLKIYEPDYIVVAMYGASIGKIAISKIRACTNQACCVLSNEKKYYDQTYAFYTLSSCKKYWIDLSQGGTQPNISAEKIKQTWLPLPPLPEQRAIVSYLDKKTTQIDSFITEAESQIEKLNELKQAQIAHWVTHGLNPDAPMKDSAIPWIGEIPEHWEVNRLAMVAYEHKMSNKEVHHQNLLSLSYGRIIRKDIGTTEGLLPASFDGYQIVEPDNIVLRLTDLQNDHKSLRVGLVTEEGIITSAYLDLGVRDNIKSKYLYYLLHSYDILKVFYSMGSGLRQSLNYAQMKKMEIVVPPLEEQTAIVSAINDLTSKIDTLTSQLTTQIDHLKELKQRIIADAVTGKIDVREENK